ncbi:MAG: nucleotidyltransferase family protein [Clostridia bacterium]|nr:nucleotidyltransferase family protein [Clostridia bacterium]
MKIAGIICEYNPFHNGHAYHIAETKKIYDGVVCVMSGDFVQRGEASLVSKHLRAAAAVLSGADLVVELPTPYSCASAERFAKGGIEILSALGVVNTLSFGAEDTDIALLQKIATILNDTSVYDNISKRLKSGVSFATAREEAIREFLPEGADIIAKPNNLLAVEYLRFLPDDMNALAIKRQGVDHDETLPCGGFASASFIREQILNGIDVSPFIPAASYEVIKDSSPVLLDDKIVLSYLKRLSMEDFKNTPDVTEGLESRIFNAVKESDTLEDLYASVKTKRYAHSRVRRIVLNAYLGITKDDLLTAPAYVRVLAMNDTGKKILKSARKKATLPIITKPTQGKGIPAFEKSVFHADLYALFSKDKQISEWKRSPFIL